MSDEIVNGVLINNDKYKCKKHGIIEEDIITVHMDIPQKGTYCMLCWAEHLAKVCEKVEKVKE